MTDARFIPSVTELPVAAIVVPEGRVREASEAGVAAIRDSIAERGLLYPLIVRRLKDGRCELVDGLHRLRAIEGLGIETAPVRCYEGRAGLIRLIEIDANLARKDLGVLDRALHLAERKRVYEREFPQAARGGDRRSAVFQNQSDTMSLWSFAELATKELGASKRNVYRLIAAGLALDTAAAQALRGAPRPVTLADLTALAKAPPEARLEAIRAFAEGAARSMAAALKPARSAAPHDPVEEALRALQLAFRRAPAAARRRFVGAHLAEIADLVDAEVRRRERPAA